MALPAALTGPSGPRQLIDPARHIVWPIIDDDCKTSVLSVLERGIFSGAFAPESMAFEEEFADYCGAKHAIFTHSGTSALVIALAVAGIGPGDEVIVPAYTFVATALAVVLVGARPVFCDVDPFTGNMRRADAEKWITSRTKAIMPVHVHGLPADLDELSALAREHEWPLIEDAAQAHGATYKGQRVGALGHGGAFSLQSSKNLGAGEGGLYVTNDLDRAELANQIRNFGQDLMLGDAKLFNHERPIDAPKALRALRPGSNYRGNEMTAALARAMLRRLPGRDAACRDNAAELTRRLAELPGVLPPVTPGDRTSAHHKYRIHFDLEAAGLAEFEPERVRDAMLAALKATGFEATLWQKTAQTAHPVFAKDETATGRLRENYRSRFPATERLLSSSLLLFTQSCPLIAQTAETVSAYADAFEQLWQQRQAIVEDYDD